MLQYNSNTCSFLFTRKFREYREYFPKEYLFARKKTTPRSKYFLGNYDWAVGISLYISTGELFFKGVLIYGDTWQSEKIMLNFYFCTTLWCLKRFYEGLEGLPKTFSGTTKKCENNKLTQFLFQYSVEKWTGL